MSEDKVVYVAYEAEKLAPILIGRAYATEQVPSGEEDSIFYMNRVPNLWIPYGKTIVLSSTPDGEGKFSVDDEVIIKANGMGVYDLRGNKSAPVRDHAPVDLTNNFRGHNLLGTYVTIEIVYKDVFGGQRGASNFYLTFK